MNVIQQIKDEIETLNKKLQLIQDKCSHPDEAMTVIGGSDTGNYDPSCDSIWDDFHCRLCDKRWRKDY